MLVDAGANANAAMEAARIIAARRGHHAVVSILVEMSSCDINAQDKYGKTALFYACKCGDVVSGRALIDAGGDINVSEAVHVGCNFAPGNAEIIRLLLAKNKNKACDR